MENSRNNRLLQFKDLLMASLSAFLQKVGLAESLVKIAKLTYIIIPMMI